MISCIIIEDQRPAQKILERYIADTPELELSGVFNNALDASAFLKENRVDLMFLDIHLPKLTGVEFLRIQTDPPKVIFTTAFPDYAVDGFELDAVDYLLKPFDFSRFFKAVSKVIESQSSPTFQKQTENYYFARIDRELVKISFPDILYVQAHGDFVYVHFENKKLLLSESLKFWDDLLQTHGFVKIHKSYVVNIHRIEKVSGNEVFIGEERITIGRLYRKDFLLRIRKS